MNDHSRYFEYLKGRSRAALMNRRWHLYPRLCRHLTGDCVDIGCGLGDMLAFRPRTIGADINPKAVEYCRRRGLRAVVMPPNVLPFRTHSFDSGILDNVLEHIVDPHNLLAEIHRVLKPRGIVLVGVPGERGYAWDLDHKVFYDAASLVSTMEICGFTHRRTFHVPFRSSTLSRLVRQYCIYATFVAT